MRSPYRLMRLAAALAFASLLAAACTPLPDYDTALTLSIRPAFADAPTVLDARDVTVGAFGDLAARGQQTATLWLSLGNGRSGTEEITFFYWRYQNDSGAWVEELRVAFEGGIYRSGLVEAGGADNIADDFKVEEYVPEDGSSGIGVITGSLAATTLTDPDTGEQIQVELSGLDALVYASSETDTDTPPVP